MNLTEALMNRHPTLRFSWSHLGGTLPFVGDRIAYFLDRLPGSICRAERSFDSYLPEFWFDSVAYSGRMLAAGLRYVPASRLMVRTDAPLLGDSTPNFRRIIDDSPDLNDDDRQATYQGTPVGFLGPDPAHLPWASAALATEAR